MSDFDKRENGYETNEQYVDMFGNKREQYYTPNFTVRDIDEVPKLENAPIVAPPNVERKQKKKEEKKNKKSGGSFKRIIAACLVLGVAGGSSIGAGYSLTQNLVIPSIAKSNKVNETIIDESKYITKVPMASESDTSRVSIIKNVYPAVVSITTKQQSSSNYFGGIIIPYELEGAGSGIIFFEDENKVYIATNNHVVENKNQVIISITGEEQVPAEIVGVDPETDLAVVSVLKSDMIDEGITDYKIAAFGDSSKLEVGETVIAIGNALGEGKVATSGMVSSNQKKINIENKTLNVIQTDAAINPGNSGGALINSAGEIIGINTAKAVENATEGMGYAIPSNEALPILEELLKNGSIARPYLGIGGSDISDDLAELYGLPVGVLVRNVIRGSGADKAGIQQGDIITDFNGKKIMNMNSLLKEVANCSVGDVVEIRIIRDGERAMTVKAEMKNSNAD